MTERGSYGCVIRPSIPCKKYYQNTVSKIFHNEKYYEEEDIISDIVSHIDSKNKFTLKKLDKCLVRKLPKKEMRECKYKSWEFPKSQIIYEYGGKDLTNLEEGKYNVKDLIPAIYNLTIGLVELEKHRICHRDIKQSNIVYKDGLFYFIDFGMALSYDKVYDDDQDFILKYNYCFYPPEFKVYYNYKFSQKGLTSIDNIEQFIKKDVKLNYVKSEIVFDNNMIDTMIKDLLNKVGSIDVLKMAMIGQANKIDVFSLGVVLMNLLLKTNDKYTEIKIKLLKILDKCIELNPYKRINPRELKKEIKALI
jgi:serine/threonine protein kinase